MGEHLHGLRNVAFIVTESVCGSTRRDELSQRCVFEQGMCGIVQAVEKRQCSSGTVTDVTRHVNIRCHGAAAIRSSAFNAGTQRAANNLRDSLMCHSSTYRDVGLCVTSVAAVMLADGLRLVIVRDVGGVFAVLSTNAVMMRSSTSRQWW